MCAYFEDLNRPETGGHPLGRLVTREVYTEAVYGMSDLSHTGHSRHPGHRVAEVTHVIHSLCIDLASRQSAQRMPSCPRTVQIFKVDTQLVIPLFRAVESMQNEGYTSVPQLLPEFYLNLNFCCSGRTYTVNLHLTR